MFLATWSGTKRSSLAARWTGYFNMESPWAIKEPPGSSIAFSATDSFRQPGPISFEAAFSVPQSVTTVTVHYRSEGGTEVTIGKGVLTGTQSTKTPPTSAGSSTKTPAGCDLGGAIASPGLIERNPFTGEARQCVKKGDSYVWVPVPPKKQVPSAESPAAPNVRDIQSRLVQLGYDPGPVDGALGPAAARAIREFQRDAGIAQSGTIDESTLKALDAREPTLPTGASVAPQAPEPNTFVGTVREAPLIAFGGTGTVQFYGMESPVLRGGGTLQPAGVLLLMTEHPDTTFLLSADKAVQTGLLVKSGQAGTVKSNKEAVGWRLRLLTRPRPVSDLERLSLPPRFRTKGQEEVVSVSRTKML